VVLNFSEESDANTIAGLAEEEYLHSAVERDNQRNRLKKLSGKLNSLVKQLDAAKARLELWSANEYTMLDHTRLGDAILSESIEDGATRQVYVGAAVGRDVRIVEELRILEVERSTVETSIADAKQKLNELDADVAAKRAKALSVAQDTMRAAHIMRLDPELVESAIYYPRGTPRGVKIAVEAAMSQIGVKYRFAASTPGVAFDCSGLTLWAVGQAGIVLSHSSRSQSAQTEPVRREDLRIGDLVFYGSPIHHVALYLGNDIVIQAPNEGRHVQYASINSWEGAQSYGRINYDAAPRPVLSRVGR
jgi:cell wall-associated NlpC family hydrolase